MQLIIKAPNQKISDYPLEAQPDWSVARLKELLFESYPSHPAVEDQKLIHGGRLLNNHLLLRDVLRHDGPLHVLHLVCRSQGVASTSTRVGSDVGPVQSPSPSQATDEGNVPLGLRYRGVATMQVPPFAGIPLSPEAMAQQMAAMQQFYANYMQHAAGMQATPPPQAVAEFSATAGPRTRAPPENAEEAEVPPMANDNNNRQNVMMNAQGGGPLFAEEEEGLNRDWLDWFYVFSRAFVLFSIVYFYSSPGRFAVVVGITTLIYMYQAGLFGVGRRQENNRPEEQGAVAAPPLPAQENDPEWHDLPNREEVNNDRVMDGTTIRDAPPPASPQEQEEATAPSALQTVWIFVSTFFASLIPEQAPPINVN